MLFTPQDTTRYQLWTERRCTWMLITGIALFVVFISISFSFTEVSPSIHVRLDPDSGAISCADKERAAWNMHGRDSITGIRVLRADGSSEVYAVDAVDLDDANKKDHSVFLILESRSLWQFLYERWQLMRSAA